MLVLLYFDFSFILLFLLFQGSEGKEIIFHSYTSHTYKLINIVILTLLRCIRRTHRVLFCMHCICMYVEWKSNIIIIIFNHRTVGIWKYYYVECILYTVLCAVWCLFFLLSLSVFCSLNSGMHLIRITKHSILLSRIQSDAFICFIVSNRMILWLAEEFCMHFFLLFLSVASSHTLYLKNCIQYSVVWHCMNCKPSN